MPREDHDREGIRRRQHAEYVAEFHKMRAAWTPAELERAIALKCDQPLPFEKSRPGWKGESEEESNPADDVVDANTPIDALEPLDVRESDLAQIGDAFTAALIWASQAKTLVEMGWRIHAMIRVFRPALLEGMKLEARLEHERQLRAAVSKSAIGNRQSAIARVGEYYRSVLWWCRRCNSLSQLGQRGFAMIYAMRRDLIGKLNTNAALGSLSNKTRQAFNKVVGDFRDSNHGFRNGVMRGELTRIKCKTSQLAAEN